MVDLKRFTECMSHLMAQEDKDEVLTNLLVCDDSSGWINTASDLVDDVITLLSENLGDDAEETKDWISWWLWEINMDALEEKRCNHVWIKNKKDNLEYKYTILDLEDLYYLIIGEEDKIKTKVQEKSPKTEQFNTFKAERDGKSLYDMFTEEIFKDKKEIEED